MITLDPYYQTSEYLKALEAMDFNSVYYTEYIDIRSKLWYLDIEGVDTAVTHKSKECENDRYLVQKVRSLEEIEETFLARKPGDTSLERYLSNDCLEELKSRGRSAVYAFLAPANDAQKLSLNGKIWWFGRHIANLGVCVSELQPPLVYKAIMAPVEAGLFDVEIRKNLLEYRTFLRKYTKQPYFWNGRFYGFRGRKIYDY